MKKILLTALFSLALAANANAQSLKVTLGNIEDGGPIPDYNAFCIATDAAKSAPGENISPAISWEKGPEGTKSYAILMVDGDVPQDFTNANKEGETIDEDEPRQNFYHWILVNIPPNVTSIPEGAGKNKNYGRQLVNDYLKFGGHKKTSQNIKKFSGYDGPCPPFNDERLHYYHFKVYALSDRFVTGDTYTGDEILRTINPYILAYGEAIGHYTLNPDLKEEAK